jgi:ketosteroid isomerase-like protein
MSWYEEFYACVDAMDIDAVLSRCTPDTTVRFANEPVSEGADAVRVTLTHVWSALAGLQHSIIRVLEGDDAALVEATVTYNLLDGRRVSLPTATVVERRDGLVAAQRIYADITPLGAPAERSGAVGAPA